MSVLARYCGRSRGISRLFEAVSRGEIWPWFVIAGIVAVMAVSYTVKRRRRGV